MWGCDYMSFSSGAPWAGGFFPGGIWYPVYGLVLLLIVCAAVRIIRAIKTDASVLQRDRLDSLAILKARFAEGEINEEEYGRMKSILRDV